MPTGLYDPKEQERIAQVARVQEENVSADKGDVMFGRYFGGDADGGSCGEMLDIDADGNEDGPKRKRSKRPKRFSKMRERRRIRRRANRESSDELDTVDALIEAAVGPPPAPQRPELDHHAMSRARRGHVSRHAQHRNTLRTAA